MILPVLFAGLLVAGCGITRKPAIGDEDLSQKRYDRGANLQLVEILSGTSGTVELNDPISVALTPEGGLAILERKVPRLILLDTNRQVVAQVGGFGLGSGQLRQPRFVRSGFGLTFNIADEGGQFLIYDARLRFVNSFEPVYEASGFTGGSPSGLAIAEFGDTYLADRDNDVVYHFDPGGKFVETIGDVDAGAGRLARPEGLTVTRDGVLIVCDTDADRIVLFDQAGEYLETIGEGEVQRPVAVTLTPDEEAILVGCRKESSLMMYALSGRLLASWDGHQLVSGGFGRVMDVVIVDSFLYLVDATGNRVLKFRLIPAVE